MIVSKNCIKIEFINSILTYKNIAPKLQFPNLGNHCLETECSSPPRSVSCSFRVNFYDRQTRILGISAVCFISKASNPCLESGSVVPERFLSLGKKCMDVSFGKNRLTV